MWKLFPDTAPYDGRRIIIGGWAPTEVEQDDTKGLVHDGAWVEVIASWTTFQYSPLEACNQNNDIIFKWVTTGFATIHNWNVNWQYWHPLPPPPPAMLKKVK